MNRKPDTTGIDRRWKKGEDARVDIRAETKGAVGDDVIDTVLTAMQKVVLRRKRTVFVGFGTFQWLPWNNRLPTGERIETWRLTFKPSRYAKGRRYHGSKR